jgi:hypothetical protein
VQLLRRWPSHTQLRGWFSPPIRGDVSLVQPDALTSVTYTALPGSFLAL